MYAPGGHRDIPWNYASGPINHWNFLCVSTHTNSDKLGFMGIKACVKIPEYSTEPSRRIAGKIWRKTNENIEYSTNKKLKNWKYKGLKQKWRILKNQKWKYWKTTNKKLEKVQIKISFMGQKGSNIPWISSTCLLTHSVKFLVFPVLDGALPLGQIPEIYGSRGIISWNVSMPSGGIRSFPMENKKIIAKKCLGQKLCSCHFEPIFEKSSHALSFAVLLIRNVTCLRQFFWRRMRTAQVFEADPLSFRSFRWRRQ